jgi:hypothetical protein
MATHITENKILLLSAICRLPLLDFKTHLRYDIIQRVFVQALLNIKEESFYEPGGKDYHRSSDKNLYMIV